MKVKYIRKSKFPERRLSFGKEYEVLDTFITIESVDGVDKELVYIQIVDNVGDKTNYAMKYGDEIWFKDIVDIRDEKINSLIN